MDMRWLYVAIVVGFTRGERGGESEVRNDKDCLAEECTTENVQNSSIRSSKFDR